MSFKLWYKCLAIVGADYQLYKISMIRLFMKQGFRPGKKHLFVWLAIIVYLFSANQLYTNLILKHGKPIKMDVQLPLETQDMRHDFNTFNLVRYDGEEVYELKGYAFLNSAPDMKNITKVIVLHSEKENLFFQADQEPRPDLNDTFKDLKTNMTFAGIRAFISKDTLKLTNYQVGILLLDANKKAIAYKLTGVYIERKPNTLRYIEDKKSQK